MRRFKLNRKLMGITLCVLMFLVFTLSIGYAALSVTLNISGNAQVNATDWNIYLTNPIVTDGSVTTTKPTITSNISANFSVNLTTPGDFYEFTVDIVNDGDINALIQGVTKTPELTESQLKYLNYIITYDDDTSVEVDQILNAGDTKTLKVKIEFKRDVNATDLPSSTETLNLSFVVDYIQTDDSEYTGWIVPEGGTYYVGVTSKSLGDYTGTTAIYNSLEKVPVIASDNDVLVLNYYEYRYNQYYNGSTWESNPNQNGWGIRVRYDDLSTYGTPIFDINNKKLTNMSNTFYYCYDLETLNADGWDTSNVTDMSSMFEKAGYSLSNDSSLELNLTNWDTSKVTNMSYMFNYIGGEATSLKINGLNDWNVQNVTTMEQMFYNSGYYVTEFKLDLSNWKPIKVTNMAYLFGYLAKNATTFELNLTGWETPQVTDMTGTFHNVGEYATTSFNVIGLEELDVHNVQNMYSMFSNFARYIDIFELDLTGWDVSNVENMAFMFSGAGCNSATSFSLTLNNWNASKVTTLKKMFYIAGSAAIDYKLSVSNLNVSSVTDITDMFSPTVGTGTFELILNNWNMSSVTSMAGMFSDAAPSATTVKVNFSSWDISSVTDLSTMFSNLGKNATSYEFIIDNWTIPNVTTVNNMFYQVGKKATTLNLDLSTWDVSSMTTTVAMFHTLGYSAKNITLNFNNWDVSNVTNMTSMFISLGGYATGTLTMNGISSWDVSNVQNMNYMFKNTGFKPSFSLNLSSWNVQSVTSHTDFNSAVTSKVLAPTFPS